MHTFIQIWIANERLPCKAYEILNGFYGNLPNRISTPLFFRGVRDGPHFPIDEVFFFIAQTSENILFLLFHPFCAFATQLNHIVNCWNFSLCISSRIERASQSASDAINLRWENMIIKSLWNIYAFDLVSIHLSSLPRSQCEQIFIQTPHFVCRAETPFDSIRQTKVNAWLSTVKLKQHKIGIYNLWLMLFSVLFCTPFAREMFAHWAHPLSNSIHFDLRNLGIFIHFNV